MRKRDIIKQSIMENTADKDEILYNITHARAEDLSAAAVQNRSCKIRMRAAACFVLVILITSAFILPSLFHSGREGSLTGFTLVAYAKDTSGETQEISMQPNVEIEIGMYSPIMSSVPGFPFQCTGEGVKSVEFSVDQGEFVLWGEDYKVRPAGSMVEVGKGTSVYWSPLSVQNDVVEDAVITVKITTNDNKTTEEKILISSNQSQGIFHYTAKRKGM